MDQTPDNLCLLMSRFLLICILSMIFVSCATTSRYNKLREAEAHYKLGISHLKEGRPQLAFVELQKTISLNPDDKRAYYVLGLIYQEFGEYNEAEASLKKALKIDPEYSEAYNSLGVLYTRTGRWEEAIEAFQKAINNPLYLNPEKALTNLGMVYYRLGKYKEAEVYFRKAIKRVPDFPRAFYGLALCYNAMGRYGDAAEAIQKAIKFDPIVNGDIDRAREYFIEMKLKALSPEEQQDYTDLIEILYY